uniref:C2H2-type domain-containing protein n=1 Tax=Culex tarsalis TaxID=7177 RepID=A0A1Q3F039_CULTA
MSQRRRSNNFQPLEVQALLKACLAYKVEEFRQAGKSTGHLFYDIQQEMAKHGNFPNRPLMHLRAHYRRVELRYKQGQKPYPPEAREIWGRLEGETDVSENDAAWKALTEKKTVLKATAMHVTKPELIELIRETTEKNVEALSVAQRKETFQDIFNNMQTKKLFLGRNADFLERTYNRLRKRYLKGKYDREFPESAALLWSRMREGVSESVDEFSTVDSSGPQANDSPEPQDLENVKTEEIDPEIVCSICQGCAYEAKHLFRDVYQNQTYAEIIIQILNVKMLWNGHSSALICQLCSTYVESLPIFWNQCRKSCDILNGELVAKENTVLEESTFCESTSKAVSPSRDVDEVASIGSEDFQANDTLDEMTFEEVSETTIGALEEVLPEEEGSNPQVEATDKSGDEQNVVKLKKNRCSYWKRVPKQCELCGKTVLDIKSHINSHYQNKPEACDFCPKRFTSRNQLLMHRNTHTRERQYPCSYCDAVYDSWGGKNYHEMLWNGHSSALICQLCSTYVEGLPIFWNQCRESCEKLNVASVTKEEPVLEESTFWESSPGAGSPPHDAESSAGCEDFQTNDNFGELSFEEMSATETPTATIDDVLDEAQPIERSKVFEKVRPVKELTREELNMLKFKESFPPSAKRRIKNVPKQCDQCGKTVIDLKSHLNSHFNNKCHACEFCPMKFTSRHQLRTHRNIHTRERKYACSYCDAVYSSWKGKNYHEKRHVEEMNNMSYSCDQCDATYKVEKNLLHHIKFKHLQVRQLQCTQCEFGTINKTRLLNHVRSIHSKERPYQCPYCNFNSNSNTGYFIHFKRHKNSGEADEYHIRCGYCEETFLKDSVFEKHILEEHPDRAIKV